jgi:hypothetical protein
MLSTGSSTAIERVREARGAPTLASITRDTLVRSLDE